MCDTMVDMSAARSNTKTLAPKYKFALSYTDEVPGGEREYEVGRRGQCIGIVGTEWLPSATEGGIPTKGWTFVHRDGRRATATSRTAAIAQALAK